MAPARAVPGSAEERLLELLEAQARAAADSSKLSAAGLSALLERARTELHQVAHRTGQSVESVATLALKRVEKVQEERSRPPAAARLEKLFKQMTPGEQYRRYFTDLNTGLFNLRGLEALRPPTGRPMLAEWDIEATKFINDHHGHEALDGVLRAAAVALSRELPDAAKVGGSLRGYVRDQAEANRIAAVIEKALDPERRLRVTAAAMPRQATLRATMDRSADAHGELKKLERATGRLGYRLGGPVALMQGAPVIAFEEGMEGVDPKSPKARTFLADVARRTAPLVERLRSSPSVGDLAFTEAHVRELRSKSSREIAEAIFIEPSTGLLTEAGFRAQPERKWKASVDMRALRDLDHALGHAGADKVIAAFGRAIADLGGGHFDASHLHGDEYVLQADSRKALKDLLKTLSKHCTGLTSFRRLPDRRLVVVRGIELAWGIGRDYDRADRIDLPRRKALMPEAKKPVLVSAGRAGRTLEALGVRGAVDLAKMLPPRTSGLVLGGLDARPMPSPTRERATSGGLER